MSESMRWALQMPLVCSLTYGCSATPSITSRIAGTDVFVGRALQEPVLDIWGGQETNRAEQHALLDRARCNRSARRGEYEAPMERG
jgi:hypothetical protein